MSQSAIGFGVEGQAYEDVLAAQRWDSAAAVAAEVAAAMLADPPDDAGVLNLNVPNLPVEEMLGWRWTSVGQSPPRAMSKATLEPRPGHEGAYRVKLEWGDETHQPEGSDTRAVQDGYVSVTWLSRIVALDPTAAVGNALDGLLHPARIAEAD